jgi:hypothetical protein
MAAAGIEAKVKENGAGKVEQPQIVVVDVDRSDSEILQLNLDKKVQLTWSTGLFRKLDEAVWKMLSPDNMKEYLKAEAVFDMEQKAIASTRVKVLTDPFDPIEGDSNFRLKIRARRGWHPCWKSPGMEFEAAMSGPYKQVRKPTKEQIEKGFEPGYESGEVLKIIDGKGDVELIAVECPEELFEQHKEYISQKSVRRFQKITEDYASGIEDINRGMKRKDGRIVPLDGDGKPLV